MAPAEDGVAVCRVHDPYPGQCYDRVIMLFADLLKTFRLHSHVFVGHIGRDDFFMGVEIPGDKWPALVDDIRDLVRRFAEDVLTVYDEQ